MHLSILSDLVDQRAIDSKKQLIDELAKIWIKDLQNLDLYKSLDGCGCHFCSKCALLEAYKLELERLIESRNTNDVSLVKILDMQIRDQEALIKRTSKVLDNIKVRMLSGSFQHKVVQVS